MRQKVARMKRSPVSNSWLRHSDFSCLGLARPGRHQWAFSSCFPCFDAGAAVGVCVGPCLSSSVATKKERGTEYLASEKVQEFYVSGVHLFFFFLEGCYLQHLLPPILFHGWLFPPQVSHINLNLQCKELCIPVECESGSESSSCCGAAFVGAATETSSPALQGTFGAGCAL